LGAHALTLLPVGWEGTITFPKDGEPSVGLGPVCPNCQYAEWHPHCTSTRADFGYGERIDTETLQRDGQLVVVGDDGIPVIVRSLEDLQELGVGWCDYIDLAVSWIEDDDEPKVWTCSKCGGTEFEGVHRDYRQSGLQGASFTTEIDGAEEEGDG
jgi:predicted nucleic-acid-binding Zn-ribbon protein